MLKNFNVLSRTQDPHAKITVSQGEFSVLLDSLVAVVIQAFMDKEKIIVEVVFDHDKNRFRVVSHRDSGIISRI